MIRARLTDPATSHAAAASVNRAELPYVKRSILTIMALDGPLTDDELWDIWQARMTTQISPSGLRTRRRELLDDGLVRDTGERRTLPTGRSAIVWGEA